NGTYLEADKFTCESSSGKWKYGKGDTLDESSRAVCVPPVIITEAAPTISSNQLYLIIGCIFGIGVPVNIGVILLIYFCKFGNNSEQHNIKKRIK
ncbi:hypothetical protein PFISCL1PPCAC_25964, partial [Pristionchus fissidentatus]